jgi:hypothetical protein
MKAPSTTASDFDSCRAHAAHACPVTVRPFPFERSSLQLRRSRELEAAGTTGADSASHLLPRQRGEGK